MSEQAQVRVVSRIICRPRRPAIGSRWTPEHVVRYDSASGTYEEVNSPCTDNDEALVQLALIARPAPPGRSPWQVLGGMVVVLMAVAIFAQAMAGRV